MQNENYLTVVDIGIHIFIDDIISWCQETAFVWMSSCCPSLQCKFILITKTNTQTDCQLFLNFLGKKQFM